MQNPENLGGSQTDQLLNQQNPQSQTGQGNFAPNNANDFQNAAPSDTLNTSANGHSLQVSNTGQPKGPGGKPGTNYKPVMFWAFSIFIVLAVILVVVYRYSRKLGERPLQGDAKPSGVFTADELTDKPAKRAAKPVALVTTSPSAAQNNAAVKKKKR
jgi:hypothetical protein